MTKRVHVHIYGVVVWNKDGACHIPLEPQITIGIIFYANMLIFSIAKIWLPWKHETCLDHDTIISAVLGLQCLKLRPKYSFKNFVTYGNVLIFLLPCLCKKCIVCRKIKRFQCLQFFLCTPKVDKAKFWQIVWLGGLTGELRQF